MGQAARDQRRYVREASRRRRRGGANRAPVPVQRVARSAADATTGAMRTVSGVANATRDAGAAVVAGDRPYVVGMLALLSLGVVMLSGPVQTYVDGRDRVELLERQLAALAEGNDRLTARRDQLQDPEEIELMAREQQGMIMPGEVPYAVVPPEVERPQLTPQLDVAPAEDRPWYRRLWDGLTELFG
jgi:cell division protein FtsB